MPHHRQGRPWVADKAPTAEEKAQAAEQKRLDAIS